MTSEVTYRAAARSDAQKIAEMERKYLFCPWTESQIEGEIENPDAMFVVAVSGGEVIGFLSGTFAADECDIGNIAVDEARRKRGIATELYARLFDAARSRGVKKAFLYVRDGNTAAQMLYKKLGFVEIGRRRAYYGSGADAIAMSKQL